MFGKRINLGDWRFSSITEKREEKDRGSVTEGIKEGGERQRFSNRRDQRGRRKTEVQ